jgi:hypothetical protein
MDDESKRLGNLDVARHTSWFTVSSGQSVQIASSLLPLLWLYILTHARDLLL